MHSPKITDQLSLRQLLLDEIDKLNKNESSPEKANAVSTLANTVLKSVNQQIYYSVQRGEKPYTAFIKAEQDPKLT